MAGHKKRIDGKIKARREKGKFPKPPTSLREIRKLFDMGYAAISRTAKRF